MAFSIDRLAESDLASIEPLLAELIGSMEDAEQFTVPQAVANCRSLAKDPDHHMLVARQGDRVVGFVNFTTRRTVLHAAPSGLIDELIVSGNERGAGVGKQLVQAVIAECRRLGCCEVEVSTEKSNSRARRFYRARGFDEDAVLLEMDLERP